MLPPSSTECPTLPVAIDPTALYRAARERLVLARMRAADRMPVGDNRPTIPAPSAK